MKSSALRNKLSLLVQRRLQVERRRSRRLAPVHRPLGLIHSSAGSEPTSARVENVSSQGVAVLAEREYAPGTVLHVLLVNAAHTFSLAVEMKVVRSSRIGPSRYLTAGPFTRPLVYEEMMPFLL